MKKLGFATIVASGLAAAILGFAAPAQAVTGVVAPTGIDHHEWVHNIQPRVNVPQVDPTVRAHQNN